MRSRVCAVLLCLLVLGAASQAAQPVLNAPGVQVWGPGGGVTYSGMRYGQEQPAADLTIEQQRKLGLNDKQILKIAEMRRDLEKERATLEAQLKAAQEAARAANEQVGRLGREMYTVYTQKITKVLESVMTEEQRKTWLDQRFADQARQWLQGFKGMLKLTEVQMDELPTMLGPVFEKYGKVDTELEDARERLGEVRQAEKLDVSAIEKGEKDLSAAETNKQNVHRLRQDELFDKMRALLNPGQVETLDKVYRRH